VPSLRDSFSFVLAFPALTCGLMTCRRCATPALSHATVQALCPKAIYGFSCACVSAVTHRPRAAPPASL